MVRSAPKQTDNHMIILLGKIITRGQSNSEAVTRDFKER